MLQLMDAAEDLSMIMVLHSLLERWACSSTMSSPDALTCSPLPNDILQVIRPMCANHAQLCDLGKMRYLVFGVGL